MSGQEESSRYRVLQIKGSIVGVHPTWAKDSQPATEDCSGINKKENGWECSWSRRRQLLEDLTSLRGMV